MTKYAGNKGKMTKLEAYESGRCFKCWYCLDICDKERYEMKREECPKYPAAKARKE